MSSDLDEQQDEILALLSIFEPEEFVWNEPKSSGEIRVCVELPTRFTVALKQGDTLSQYEISSLPPLRLTFDLPEDYPSCSPPAFTLNCSWLTTKQLSLLSAHLNDLYQTTGGAVVLFSWAQFLKYEILSFFGITDILEIPSNGVHKSGTNLDNSDNKDLTLEDNKLNIASSTNCNGGASEVARFEAQITATLEMPSNGVNESSTNLDNSDDKDSTLEENKLKTACAANCDEGGSEVSRLEAQIPLSLSSGQELLSQLLIHDAAQKEKAFSREQFECGVCFGNWLGSECIQITECGHVFCRTCLADFCKFQIQNGNVTDVKCAQTDCKAAPTPAQVRSLVGEELFSRYDRLLLQSTLDSMPDVVYCPRPSCASPVLSDSSSSMGLCTVCSFSFCVLCKKTYHGTEACYTPGPREERAKGAEGQTEPYAPIPQSQVGRMALWDDYSSGGRKRQRVLEDRYGRRTLLGFLESCLTSDWIRVNTKNCPHCFSRIQKTEGCNRMTCSWCRRLFCWNCLTKTPGSEHFRYYCPLYPWLRPPASPLTPTTPY
ncbi:hypothetical protein NQD34_002196 [Periophthalmus magnuspinnatus]|nr:hypothetical protein NQD34_002196 [Periophthalmus magnuspinnatus]